MILLLIAFAAMLQAQKNNLCLNLCLNLTGYSFPCTVTSCIPHCYSAIDRQNIIYIYIYVYMSKMLAVYSLVIMKTH